MRNHSRVLLFAAASVLALSACPPSYPKCETDDHCASHGEVCVQGECRECATDANCKPGFVCDANKCVPKPECVDDAACGPGKKCRGGRCAVEQKAEGSCSTSDDCPSGEECVSGRCATKSAATCKFEPIRFDFNDAKLSSEAQSVLAQLADCIKRGSLKLRLEGHADERGTEEYNLQLSNRRAASVKRYLTDLGVGDGALEPVGYGENRPAVQGASESAWAANRRVELVKK